MADTKFPPVGPEPDESTEFDRDRDSMSSVQSTCPLRARPDTWASNTCRTVRWFRRPATGEPVSSTIDSNIGRSGPRNQE